MLILLGMPIVQIILFGFAISTEVKNVRTAILSPSYDIAVQQVAERLGANEYFQITEVVRSPEELQEEFRKAGFEIESEDPQAVIVAFDRTRCYERLCRAAYFISRDVPAFATHPDPFCPTDQPTFLPDCGAFVCCLEKATGKRIKVLGKPDPEMLKLAAARFGLSTAETMMIGDRLYTDVKLGLNAHAIAVQVTDHAEPNQSGVDPDLAVPNLGDLQNILAKVLD